MSLPSDPSRARLPILEEVGDELHRLFRAKETRSPRLGAILDWVRTRPRTLVLLVGVLVAATGAAAAVSLSGGRTSPVRLPGGGSLCPTGYEYLAYPRLRLVYPPNYPAALPRDVHGTACYASEQDALSAGYMAAPTPAGDARIGPLYVGDASAFAARACRSAQRLVGVPVFCPRRLPAPWQDVAQGSIPAPPLSPDCPSAGCGVRMLYISGSFSAPSSYVGLAPGQGELSVWAASLAQQRVFPYLVGLDDLLGCTRTARALRGTMFRGHHATWYACPAHENAGLALQWQIGKEVYGISSLGPAIVSRPLIEYVAAHLVRLAPAR
jgi:hypothetical protein